MLIGSEKLDSLARRENLKWIPIVTGTIGTIFGLVVQLYSAEVRSALESVGSRVLAQASIIAVAVFLSSGATVAISTLILRRERALRITPHSLVIEADALAESMPDDDAVVGRSIKYIERVTASNELVIFLHGLGLDAEDFRQTMRESRYHCVAFTLFGFNVEERDDERYAPISLDGHLELASYIIKDFILRYPRKQVLLVGFSLGADLVMFLAERWRKQQRDAPKIHAMLLLDPNVNRSTMNISGAISRMEAPHPLDALRALVTDAESLIEFRNMCEYLHKITRKDLDQIRRFAKEATDCWESDETYDQFFSRLTAVTNVTTRQRVVLSFAYQRHFNSVVRTARGLGLRPELFESTHCDHFGLIEPERLEQTITRLLRP